jgi:hypothetical protein
LHFGQTASGAFHLFPSKKNVQVGTHKRAALTLLRTQICAHSGQKINHVFGDGLFHEVRVRFLRGVRIERIVPRGNQPFRVASFVNGLTVLIGTAVLVQIDGLIADWADESAWEALVFALCKEKSSPFIRDAHRISRLRIGGGCIMFWNVELAEVRPWLRLASPKIQRNLPAKGELIQDPKERGILRIHV